MDDVQGSMLSSSFGGQYDKEKANLADVKADLNVTLEELYNGCVKVLHYKRKVLNSDGRTTSDKEDSKDVEIFKGCDSNLTIKFPGLGNEAPGLKNCKIR